jgi:hypothetical protein
MLKDWFTYCVCQLHGARMTLPAHAEGCMKKHVPISIVICVIVAFCLLSQPLYVSANSPPIAPWLSIDINNLPQSVAFADLLIKLDFEDKNYSHANLQNLAQYSLSEESDIVLYNIGGFKSFTFHYNDAVSAIDVSKERGNNGISSRITFTRDTEYKKIYTQLEDLKNSYSTVKLVFIDEEGGIVSVSEAFTLPKSSGLFDFHNYIEYDYQSGDVNPRISINMWFILASLLYTGFFVLLSVGVEVLAALLFQFRGRVIAFIAMVNVLTQTVMRIAYILLPLPHLFPVVLLELLVYSSEFFIYRKSKIMASEKTSWLRLYVIVANTLSLFIVVLLRGLAKWHKAF